VVASKRVARNRVVASKRVARNRVVASKRVARNRVVASNHETDDLYTVTYENPAFLQSGFFIVYCIL
jgi:hypothetical protein